MKIARKLLIFSASCFILVLFTGCSLFSHTDPATEEGTIGFDQMCTANEDICAWLSIPGTELSLPVLQSRSGDDEYYLTHTADGREDGLGCLFTQQRYNSRDFTDPVTVVYGRRGSRGELFAPLQKLYTENGSLQRCGKICVKTTEQELVYQVFASGAYSDKHILFFYDCFRDSEDIPCFLSEFKQYHTMIRQFDDSLAVGAEDRILILSTSLEQDQNQRYLVLAKLIEEIG